MFKYSKVHQRPLYARGETWDEFKDQLGIVAMPELRRMEIRDEETREICDAMLEIGPSISTNCRNESLKNGVVPNISLIIASQISLATLTLYPPIAIRGHILQRMSLEPPYSAFRSAH